MSELPDGGSPVEHTDVSQSATEQIGLTLGDIVHDEAGKSPVPSPHRHRVTGTSGSPPKKSSPPKTSMNGNKLPPGMDVGASSLAAISARLMPYLTPAELEIARINRETAATARVNRFLRSDEDDSVDSKATQDNAGELPSGSHAASALTTAIHGSGSALHDSIVAEEWVNLHLETSGAYLPPVSDIQSLLQQADVQGILGNDAIGDEDGTFAFRRKGDYNGPLARAGVDRWTLYRLGMPKDLVDRLYRALYVYTNGFHNIINEIASHCPPSVEKHVSSNVWLTFLLLLEQCENGKYEMAMLKFKQATQEWRREMQEEFANEKLRMEAHSQSIEAQLHDELARSAEKSELIARLATDTSNANEAIAQMQNVINDLTEQVRLLKLEILVHEDTEKNLNAQIDDVRKDFEMANSERFNALMERYALDEEMRKTHLEFERLEAEKSNYAKRMHETLFMNQALRATNESLKQSVVVLNMDKEKLESEKQAAQHQIMKLDQDLQDIKLLKASVEHDLVESVRRQAHLEERLRAMKEQLDAEMENAARCVKDISNLSTQIDEEKVKVGVLEAKCNLLTAEKQNTGMRAQDKLRIERLLNQKLELENQIETMKIERTKDQEQIWNLRASLEALDSELQQTKRVFSAGQQAFLHSERTAEQLRHQLHEVEKNYEKSSKNLTSLRERFKMFEESSKEQVTKLEVELKVTSAQLREVTYVNRDNAAAIADLTKTLEVLEKEAKVLKSKLETSEKQFNQLLGEKENLQRDQLQRDQQSSSTKQIVTKFIRELQGILALVKLDEYPLDEALREVLRMVKDTFGQELDITKVLDDEDEPLNFEEEYDEEELVEEERERKSRLQARRAGVSVGINSPGSLDDDTLDPGDTTGHLPGVEVDGDGKRRLTKVSRMSKFRRSKLDTQIKKLQREVENNGDFVRSLEGVVCSQADEIAILTATKEQQLRWLKLNEHQKGMLLSEIEGYRLALSDSRTTQKRTHVLLEEAKIDLVMESNKTFQMELLLQALRRQYDMQVMASEDLLCKIGRLYEYEQLMRSLRREKEIQATVSMADDFSQTLVPQRNPVLERVRIPAMNLPALNPISQHAESIIQQINDNAKALLPNVTTTMDLQLHPSQASLAPATHQGYALGPQSLGPALQTRTLSPRLPVGSRAQRGRGQKHRHRQLLSTEQVPPATAGAPPKLARHFNEFGMRQDVLISPVLPPYFPSQLPGTVLPNRGSKIPSKPQAARQYLRLSLHGGDERGDVGWDARVQPLALPTTAQPRRRRQHDPRGDVSSEQITGSQLRYHRGFLRAGMEVLRGGGQNDEAFEDEGDYPEDGFDYEQGDDDDLQNGDGRRGYQSSRASFHSPSKLEIAVRDYHDEQDPAIASGTSPRRSPSRYYSHRLKESESRDTLTVDNRDKEEFDEDEDDRTLAQDTLNSRFVPGVLYPILPPR